MLPESKIRRGEKGGQKRAEEKAEDDETKQGQEEMGKTMVKQMANILASHSTRALIQVFQIKGER